MNGKRNCIFTNEPSNAKLTISSSKHNWVKSVPCTKEFLKHKGDRRLNGLEFKLVELFYKQELAKLKIESYEDQMVEIRKKMEFDLSAEDIEWLEADLGEWDEEESDDWALNEPSPPKLTEEEERIFEEFEKIEEEEEDCPKCTTPMRNAPGIGPFCPNKECLVGDGPDLYKKENKLLTPEENYDRVKKVIKKKDNLWE